MAPSLRRKLRAPVAASTWFSESIRLSTPPTPALPAAAALAVTAARSIAAVASMSIAADCSMRASAPIVARVWLRLTMSALARPTPTLPAADTPPAKAVAEDWLSASRSTVPLVFTRAPSPIVASVRSSKTFTENEPVTATCSPPAPAMVSV